MLLETFYEDRANSVCTGAHKRIEVHYGRNFLTKYFNVFRLLSLWWNEHIVLTHSKWWEYSNNSIHNLLRKMIEGSFQVAFVKFSNKFNLKNTISCVKIQFPVFDGFTCCRISWTRFDYLWKMPVCLWQKFCGKCNSRINKQNFMKHCI